MALWTAKQVWGALSRERRETAALSIWEDDQLNRASRMAALIPWLTARGMRMEFLEKLPRARRAAMMADGGMPEETAMQALMSYHLRHQRPLLGRLLDELQIPHENGLIKEGHTPEPPAEDALRAALEKIRADYPAEDVDAYVRTLTATDPETWANLAPLAGDPA